MPNIAKSIKGIAFRSGLYLGAILAVITITAYSIDWDLMMSPWFQPIKLLLVILFAIYATYQGRRHHRQKYSFRNAFSAYFITLALGLFIFTLVNYILFDLYDPAAGEYLSRLSIDQIRETLEKAGRDPEKIKANIEALKHSDQFSIANQFKGYVFNLALYAMFGVIVAFIFKKKKPILV